MTRLFIIFLVLCGGLTAKELSKIDCEKATDCKVLKECLKNPRLSLDQRKLHYRECRKRNLNNNLHYLNITKQIVCLHTAIDKLSRPWWKR